MSKDTTDEIEGDALFQMNAAISAVLPDSPGVGDRAFHDAGYRLHAISPQISPSPDDAAAMAKEQVLHKLAPSADVLYWNPETRHAVVVECKRSSFGIKSTNAAQGTGIAAACGRGLNDSIGLNTAATTFSYLSRAGQRNGFTDLFKEMSGTLSKCDIPFPECGFIGLRRSDDRILMDLDGLPAACSVTEEPAFVCNIDESGRADLFYLLPIDPDVGPSKYGDSILRDRVLRSILMRAGRVRPPGRVEFPADELLNEATLGISRRIESTKALKNLRKKVRAILRALSNDLKVHGISEIDMSDPPSAHFHTLEGKATFLKVAGGLDAQKVRIDVPVQGELFRED